MTVVSAFLVHGSPLPYLRSDNPAWAGLDRGYRAAGAALAASRPDVIAVYSTQWLAVLDQLWQLKARIGGVHVDENWHEYGDLAFDLRIDTRLTRAVIEATPDFGVRSKGVAYDGFPVDTGTIVANNYLNPRGRLPLVIAANNVYHDWDTTARLGAAVVACAARLGRRVALVGVGGLSGTIFREEIDVARDHLASDADDKWNRRILKLLAAGDAAKLLAACPKFARAARVDMGFKHLAWILGGLGTRYRGATVHAYGPSWGAGAAVVEFALAPARARAKNKTAAGKEIARKAAGKRTNKKAAAGRAGREKIARKAPAAKAARSKAGGVGAGGTARRARRR